MSVIVIQMMQTDDAVYFATVVVPGKNAFTGESDNVQPNANSIIIQLRHSATICVEFSTRHPIDPYANLSVWCIMSL